MCALLQVALDIISLRAALKIAKEVIEGGADLLEIGTPLIKAEGVHSIRVLRESFPEAKIVADMKIADCGYLEASLAFEAGADMVTVLGAADVETIKSVLRRATELGKEVMVDTLGVKELEEVVLKAYSLGAHYVCLHVGIDVQRSRGIKVDNLKEYAFRIKDRYGIKVAVAGGIDEESARLYKDLDIIVVGKAITGSVKPREATERILRAMGKL
ncbi:MAG: orotidine 5-phosphate decarboxylase [Thermofilum sp. ex4484_15]|nr:MAG: orotidine 5-phosphate decarboxylase [Thermofilum sp. ex4484_15]